MSTLKTNSTGEQRQEMSALSDEAMQASEEVSTGLFPDGRMLPLVLKPKATRVNLSEWVEGNREAVESLLLKHGALLFRDFGAASSTEFEQFIRAASGDPLDYQERSSPRSRVSGNIFTSTDYPASKSILLHNENSYQNSWPMKLFFYCETPPQSGGETPLADCRQVFAQIDPEIRERFAQKKWMLVRNYNDGFGLTWQTVFQTEDKRVVEEHCRRQGIEVEWKEGERLRTRAIRPAIARHPRTGEHVWFNHALFFHISSMEAGIREALLDEFEDDELPSNTFYGDGSPIEPETLDHLRKAYTDATVAFPWTKGDILMLDNMLTAHSRAPYKGARKVLVGMSQPINREDV
ncbi:MAG TPA: TauD/TfdA family dioxygenase [Pyrinomonadaceae bacterium]|jgi:alpha-ketoglutarate-dependent taurine dioxygenase